MTSTIFWMDHFLPRLFSDRSVIPLGVESVLEVGPGKGLMGRALRLLRPVKQLDAIEAWPAYAKVCAESGDYDLIITEQVETVELEELPYLKVDRYDLAVCIETLEHLDRTDAMCLLEDLKRVARRVVVTTPGHEHNQGVLDGNPYQEHKCMVTRRELRAHQYDVRGLGGIRFPGVPINSLTLQRWLPSLHQSILGVWNEEGNCSRCGYLMRLEHGDNGGLIWICPECFHCGNASRSNLKPEGE